MEAPPSLAPRSQTGSAVERDLRSSAGKSTEPCPSTRDRQQTCWGVNGPLNTDVNTRVHSAFIFVLLVFFFFQKATSNQTKPLTFSRENRRTQVKPFRKSTNYFFFFFWSPQGKSRERGHTHVDNVECMSDIKHNVTVFAASKLSVLSSS